MAQTDGESVGYQFRPISQGDRLNGVSAGDSDYLPLKVFLTKHAKYYESSRLARTYGLYEAAKIIGYITLVCSEIDLGGSATLHPTTSAEKSARYPYTTYPALKLARLLIDSRYRGKALGRQLVEFAFGMAADEICPRVGCRFLVVDSKQNSIEFYKKCGFTLLETPSNRKLESPLMFVDLMSVDKLRSKGSFAASSGGTYQTG